MSIIYNGTEVDTVIYNGTELDVVNYNGVEVFSASAPADYSYTGSSSLTWEDSKNWYLKLTSSGTLTVNNQKGFKNVDIFLSGGGQKTWAMCTLSDGTQYIYAGDGGYYSNNYSKSIGNGSYSVTIGASTSKNALDGNAHACATDTFYGGGATSAFGITANGAAQFSHYTCSNRNSQRTGTYPFNSSTYGKWGQTQQSGVVIIRNHRS